MRILTVKGFTRVPTFEEDREHINGYVMLQDLSAAQTLNRSHTGLRTLAKRISFVPETVNCLTLLMTFLKFRRHIAIVSDEYGGVAGRASRVGRGSPVFGFRCSDGGAMRLMMWGGCVISWRQFFPHFTCWMLEMKTPTGRRK